MSSIIAPKDTEINQSENTALLKSISLSMFRKGFLGTHSGSLSVKKSSDSFMINKRDAVFDHIEDKSLIEISISKHSLWGLASFHTPIHSAIYESFASAKYIACVAPAKIVAYSIIKNHIKPIDYHGQLVFNDISVLDPKNTSDWYTRAPSQVVNYMKKRSINYVVVRGVGLYVHAREMRELVSIVEAITESCEVLLLCDR